MKVVVCVKQISHTYARTGMDPDSDFIAPEDHVFVINPYDESAIGMALHIKKLVGGGEITLLILGPIIAEIELRRCLAMGADHLYQIDESGKTDSWSKSIFLAKAIKHLGADIVLCGKESLDNRNGQMGALMAHHLEMPYVSCIRDISVSEDQRSAEVKMSAGRGMFEIIESPLPVVLSVDVSSVYSIFPAYEEKQLSQSLPVQEILFDKGTVSPKSICKKTFTPRPRPKKDPASDHELEAYDRIIQLLTGSRVEKKGEILRGNPESQVEGIISFLDDHGFLETLKAQIKRGSKLGH